MSLDDDRGYYFQTTTSQDATKRRSEKSRNTHGNPLRLNAKISAITVDPKDAGCVYVADTTGLARRIRLETHETTHTYRGPTAPLTCLTADQSGSLLFAGCWDKSIYSWQASTPRRPARRYHGHTDFVKCVLCTHLPTQPTPSISTPAPDDAALLISGAADGTIIIWRVSTAEKLHVTKAHARGVLDLALDPLSLPPSSEPGFPTVLFSASSTREIARWELTATTFRERNPPAARPARLSGPPGGLQNNNENNDDDKSPGDPVLAHETSVKRLRFSTGSEDADLWTASSDKTTRCLLRGSGFREVETSLEHADWVRDVVIDEEGGWVVTACRDEEVRVWDLGSGELVHTYSGHFDAVEALCVVRVGEGRGARVLVSGGLDGTLRQWSLEREEVQRLRKVADVDDGEQEVMVVNKDGVVTTEEEERELAELMAEGDLSD